MKKSIIFHTNHNFLERPKELESGSSVRPKKIYKAFLEAGYEVFLIQGSRGQRINQALKTLSSKKKYLFCYSETSVGPLNPWDIFLYLILKIKKIPLGVFYRDFYWRVPELYPYKGIKGQYLILRHKFDLLILRIFPKVVFFSSKTAASWFNFKNFCPLPPGCENFSQNLRFSNNFILVGSAAGRYGTFIILEAFKEINKKQKRCKLILVCRPHEKYFFKNYFKFQNQWLEISTLSGESLKNVYKKSSWALVMLRRIPYNDIAMPVKMFEYLSYGLPVISSNCFEVEKFIKTHNIGLTFKDNKESFKEALLKVIDNKILWEGYRKNILKVTKKYSWKNKIKEIEKCLLGRNYR